eukprot:1161677-Pelagomonas_calceolata.AAC.12
MVSLPLQGAPCKDNADAGEALRPTAAASGAMNSVLLAACNCCGWTIMEVGWLVWALELVPGALLVPSAQERGLSALVATDSECLLFATDLQQLVGRGRNHACMITLN